MKKGVSMRDKKYEQSLMHLVNTFETTGFENGVDNESR